MTTVATGQVLLTGTPPAGLAASFAALHGVSALLGLSGCGQSISYENGNVIIVWLRLCHAVFHNAHSKYGPEFRDRKQRRSPICWSRRANGLQATSKIGSEARALLSSSCRMQWRQSSRCLWVHR